MQRCCSLYCVLSSGSLSCYFTPEEIDAKVQPTLNIPINKVRHNNEHFATAKELITQKKVQNFTFNTIVCVYSVEFVDYNCCHLSHHNNIMNQTTYY